MEIPIQYNLTNPSESNRICSPFSVNENLSVNSSHLMDATKTEDSDLEQVEKTVARTYCVVKTQDPSKSEEKKKLERFRTFWSNCNHNLEDDDDIDKLDCVNIEQLVDEEMKSTVI